MAFASVGFRGLSRRAMLKRFARALLFVVFGLTVAACSSTQTTSVSTLATQAPNGKGTEFDLPLRNNAADVSLVNQLGVKTSLGELKGKYVVITPFLTICQDVCPMISANFGRLAQTISKAGLDSKIALVELTVDPETDTPSRLAAYQKIYGARPNWSFYTGEPAAVSQVLGALGIAFEKTMLTPAEMKTGNPDWLTGKVWNYDVSHQDAVIIIGPDGHEKWLEEGIANTQGNSIPDSLKKYLSEDGRSNLQTPDPNGSWTNSDVLAELSKLGGFKFS